MSEISFDEAMRLYVDHVVVERESPHRPAVPPERDHVDAAHHRVVDHGGGEQHHLNTVATASPDPLLIVKSPSVASLDGFTRMTSVAWPSPFVTTTGRRSSSIERRSWWLG